jgi:hypothetical protein
VGERDSQTGSCDCLGIECCELEQCSDVPPYLSNKAKQVLLFLLLTLRGYSLIRFINKE